MRLKNKLTFVFSLELFLAFWIPGDCFAEIDYRQVFTKGVWATDCNPELKAAPAFFIDSDARQITILHLYGDQINQGFEIKNFSIKDDTISYQYEYKGKESRETIKLNESEFKVLSSINSYDLRENTVFKNCGLGTFIFKYAERVKIKLENYRSTIKSGVKEIDVIDMIVNINEYINKRVLIQCTINSMGIDFGLCHSRDGSQSIFIEKVDIDKDFYKWLLTNCARRFYEQNNSGCTNVWVTGIVMNKVSPGLKNVKLYGLEEDFPYTE